MVFADPRFALSFAPLAESALLVRVGPGEAIDPDVVAAVTALTHALDATPPPGVTDIVPAYCTIVIDFDPAETDGDAVSAAVQAVAAGGVGDAAGQERTVIIPVAYGGEHGPDLTEMAALVGLPSDEVVRRHAGGDYRVACLGFSPGWAYLLGLPPELAVPRRSEPRTRIPVGSVAVGGAQTGVYPLESPGGWRLIGRTPLAMFDPERDEPFLLRQGDKVRFAPIDAGRFAELANRG